MKPVTILERLPHRVVRPAVWMLVASLALTGTSQAVAALPPRPNACGLAEPCAGQGLPPGLLIIDTGVPDGRMAMASRLAGHGLIEIEAADDFSVTTDLRVFQATITGLLPSGAPLWTIEDVDLEMYRIFPLDSNTVRTITVPTRVKSPSDVDFGERSASANQLVYTAAILNPSFNAANSVKDGIHPAPGQTTGGEGAVNGEEVRISITLKDPFTLAAGHYFFIPKLKLSSGTWYWLSAPGPALFPGDLQVWIRNSALDPDWLRVGTDIVGGVTPPKFNGSFSLRKGREVFLPVVLR